MKNKITQWLKENIGKWTVLVAVSAFLFGPFLQSRFTGFLENNFPEKGLTILGCSPIKNSLMVVTSSNEDDKKIHSANSAPFFMITSFALVNRSESIQKDSRIYLGLINEASNSLATANFLTTNRVDVEAINVEYNDDGSFVIAVGDIYPGDIIVGGIGAMHPTATFVDVRTNKASTREIINPGDCARDLLTLKGIEPKEFYSNYDFPEPDSKPSFMINDITEPIGPIVFERVFHYNCGEGLREAIFQVIPSKGESIEICGNTYSNTGS